MGCCHYRNAFRASFSFFCGDIQTIFFPCLLLLRSAKKLYRPWRRKLAIALHPTWLYHFRAPLVDKKNIKNTAGRRTTPESCFHTQIPARCLARRIQCNTASHSPIIFQHWPKTNSLLGVGLNVSAKHTPIMSHDTSLVDSELRYGL